MKVQNKVVVVTGGGNGIGRALVLNLLSKGARVAAVNINETALQETVELAGNRQSQLSTHVVNVTHKEAVAALPAHVISRHGAVDGLINNAGIIQPFVRINDLDYAVIDKVMNANFYGMLYMTKAFLPHFLARPEAHIANISSVGGFIPVPGQTMYGAAKAAVKLFTEGLHAELSNTMVRVTVVFPGAIGTNIAVNSGVTISPGAENRHRAITPLAPRKAAHIIIAGMEQNHYRILVGSDAAFMDFIYRVNSRYATRLIARQMQSLLPE